jgi:hypothetical protein
MNQLQKPAGKCCDIMPVGDSHGVFVDGIQYDTFAKAESLRATIVAPWAAYYNQRAAELEQPTEVAG